MCINEDSYGEELTEESQSNKAAVFQALQREKENSAHMCLPREELSSISKKFKINESRIGIQVPV